MVKVRLVDKKVNSHVGRVIVTNVMAQYKMLGKMVNKPKVRPPNMLSVERAAAGASAGV